MNINQIRAEEDGKILAIPEVAEILDRKRRNTPLCFDAVKKLVEALQPGMARQANLERYGGGWRLRFSLYGGDGVPRRKSIVIEDVAAMTWVRDFLAQSRLKRGEHMAKLRIQKLYKSWGMTEEDDGDALNEFP